MLLVSSVIITVEPEDLSTSRFKNNLELDLLIDAISGCQQAVYPDLKTLHQYSLVDIQQRNHADNEAKQSAFESLFGKSNTVSAEEFKQVFAETGIDLDDRLAFFNVKGKLMEEQIAQYVNFGKIVPGFKNINPKDISRLLKASHLEFWIFGNYMLFNDELGLAISADGSRNSTKQQIEKFWSREWVDLAFKMAESIKKLHLSIEEIALIRVIILTFTDRCELSDRHHIQAMQEKFMECLQYQISKTGQHPSKLHHIMNRLLALREFTEINFKENKNFLQKWEFVINEFPLWKEILSFDEY
ncbi:hypothetical protein ACF0H5_015802 [Mactra antiquata]